MGEDRRREANQRNAQKSTGPRTASGKARSSKNATRHGLLSQRMLLEGESEEELKALRQGIRQSLRPVGELEEELVERMVAATWRKRRGDRVELGLWDWRATVSSGKSTLANVFFMDSQHDQSLQKLTRYMAAYSGEFRRAFHMLGEAQAVRKEQANEDHWVDEEAEVEGLDEGVENEEEDDDGEDDPDGGASVAPASESISEGQATEFALGPAWTTRAECSTPRPGVEPRAPVDVARPEAPDRSRWEDMSSAERALFMVRNRKQVFAVNEILDEVLLNRQWIERMSVRNLLRVSSSFTSMIWETTRGIDDLLKDDDRQRKFTPGH